MQTTSIKLAKDSLKASRKDREEKRRKLKSENGERLGTLKKFWADGFRTSKILAHNGAVAIAWAVPMILAAYIALQGAFYLVAIVLGQTGGILMETAVDVITVYVVIAVVCGFDMFFAFKIENAAIRAMKRRFWKADYKNGGIDKGEAWRERHPESAE